MLVNNVVLCRNYNCPGQHTIDEVKVTLGKTCYLFSSHHDTSLQQQLPQSILSSTITVVSLRDPVHRVISAFNHLNEADVKGRSFDDIMVLYQQWIDERAKLFIVNQATLQLAGRCKVAMVRASPIRSEMH